MEIGVKIQYKDIKLFLFDVLFIICIRSIQIYLLHNIHPTSLFSDSEHLARSSHHHCAPCHNS